CAKGASHLFEAPHQSRRPHQGVADAGGAATCNPAQGVRLTVIGQFHRENRTGGRRARLRIPSRGRGGWAAAREETRLSGVPPPPVSGDPNRGIEDRSQRLRSTAAIRYQVRLELIRQYVYHI